MIRCPCGFVAPGPMHFRGPGACPHREGYRAALRRERAARLTQRFDAIRQACQNAERAPTETEWAEMAELRRMIADG